MAAITSSPFTHAVVSSIRSVYPEFLADKSFDNTGLLLEAPFDPTRKPQNTSVLLANDLTTAVADEAIERRHSVIVAYHPIIFRGLKSLTLADSQQRSLLRLAAEGISVYCPHTAVDAVEGGNADWLGDVVTGELTGVEHGIRQSSGTPIAKDYELHHFPSSFDAQPHRVKLASIAHKRIPISPNAHSPTTGTGRLVTLTTPLPLSTILTTLTTYLGYPPSISLATPTTITTTTTSPSKIPIRTIAICCGSGGSVFAQLEEHADLLLTGEMTHHEALAAIEKGSCVVCLHHSNSERAFLGAVMRPLLQREIEKEWVQEGEGKEGEVSVVVSTSDRDPFGYALLRK